MTKGQIRTLTLGSFIAVLFGPALMVWIQENIAAAYAWPLFGLIGTSVFIGAVILVMLLVGWLSSLEI